MNIDEADKLNRDLLVAHYTLAVKGGKIEEKACA